MDYRNFSAGSRKWSAIGYGMWGLASWSGSDEKEISESLQEAVNLGVNFFDTAWAYGSGKSEQILGKLMAENPQKDLFAATKVPPQNFHWPAKRSFSLQEVFPYRHIVDYAHKSLANLGLSSIDLLQFHVWNDLWAEEEEWKRAIDDLKKEGVVKSFGISVNRFEPTNVLKTLESGLIDSVQVVYNLLDQNPEDELFPFCIERNIAIIARVPFDEGSLTGTLSLETRFPEDDWRFRYFNQANLAQTLPRVEAIKQDLPPGMTLPELALRYILQHPAVTTVIPGMRKKAHVVQNTQAADGVRLPDSLYQKLKAHRWVRSAEQNPTP